ncbi:unnamed protein product [Amoebophrya sp. A120]|nr:unnamed protein product [Amoebophrya sp. A120]|eukprot:GSA120T00001282001.1
MSVLFPSTTSGGAGGATTTGQINRPSLGVPGMPKLSASFTAQPFQFYSAPPDPGPQFVQSNNTYAAAKLEFGAKVDGGGGGFAGATSNLLEKEQDPTGPPSSATSSSMNVDYGKYTYDFSAPPPVDASQGLWKKPAGGLDEWKETLANYERLMQAELTDLWPQPDLFDRNASTSPAFELPLSTPDVPATTIVNTQDGPPTKMVNDLSTVSGLLGFESYFGGSSSSSSAAPEIKPKPLLEEQNSTSKHSISADHGTGSVPLSPDIDKFLRETDHLVVGNTARSAPRSYSTDQEEGFASVVSWAGSTLWSALGAVESSQPLLRSMSRARAALPPMRADGSLAGAPEQLAPFSAASTRALSVVPEFETKSASQPSKPKSSQPAGAPPPAVSSKKPPARPPVEPMWWVRSNIDSELGKKPSFAEKEYFQVTSSTSKQDSFIPEESRKLATEASGNSISLSSIQQLLKEKGNCSISCRKGHKEGTPNHDAWSFLHYPTKQWGDLKICGVYDGHGKFGEVTSQVVTNLMVKLLVENLGKISADIHPKGPGYLDNNIKELRGLGGCMEATFEQMHETLECLTVKTLQEYVDGEGVFPAELDARESGTTATMILKGDGPVDPWILIGHIGDGKAVLFRANGTHTALTKDHRPDTPEEKARIEEAGTAEIQSFYVSKGTVRPWDPRIVTAGQTWPALNMSRVFGDLHAHEQGVTCMPDVRLLDAKRGDILCVATDGVWDVFEEVEELRPLLHSGASAINEEAKKRWRRLSRRHYLRCDEAVVGVVRRATGRSLLVCVCEVELHFPYAYLLGEVVMIFQYYLFASRRNNNKRTQTKPR